MNLFAHMFIDPEFLKEFVDKESSAVNGEYEIDISSEDWKFENILTIISNKEHPMSRFTIGNTETLRKEGII